jgi:hypothetical protein
LRKASQNPMAALSSTKRRRRWRDREAEEDSVVETAAVVLLYLEAWMDGAEGATGRPRVGGGRKKRERGKRRKGIIGVRQSYGV